MFGQTDPFHGYYEQLYELMHPEFTWIGEYQLWLLKKAWIDCGGQSMFGEKYPNMPNLIQVALRESLGTGETASPDSYRFKITPGFTFRGQICTIVKNAFRQDVSSNVVFRQVVVDEIKALIRYELENIGFDIYESLIFVNTLMTQDVQASARSMSYEEQVAQTVKAVQTYEQQRPDTTYKTASVGPVESFMASPLLLIGAGVLALALLMKKKKRRKK